MLRVGVWIPLPKESHWQGEGIARTIEFIIQGMIESGLIGEDMSLAIYSTHWSRETMQRSFEETLGDKVSKIEFRYVSEDSVKKFFQPLAAAIADALYAGPVLLNEKLDFFHGPMKRRKIERYFKGRDSVEFGAPVVWDATVRKPESPFFLGRWLFALRLQKFERTHGIGLRELLKNRKEILSGKNKDRDLRNRFNKPNSDWLYNRAEKSIRKLPLGQKVLNRIQFYTERRATLKSIVSFADPATNDVDVWWTPSPVVQGAELLAKPNLVNFYDFFVGEYGYHWGVAQVTEIYFRLALVLSRATQIITQSRTNKYEKLLNPFEVTLDQVTVANFACPSHYASYLKSYRPGSGVKTDASLKEAADIARGEFELRARATNRYTDYSRVGGQNDELARFEFESEKFILISTQNRPYKNLRFLIDIMPKLINLLGDDVRFFFTAELNFSDTTDPLVQRIFRKKLQRFIYSVPRLPNKVHAALYHCATMTLHPSLAEGGVGSYPFMEGMVMGTPGLTGAGDHTEEGKNLHPEYERVTYRVNDGEHAIRRIAEIMKDPAAAFVQQRPIFEMHEKWTWQHVAKVYRDALWSTSGRTDYAPLLLSVSNDISPYFEDKGLREQPPRGYTALQEPQAGGRGSGPPAVALAHKAGQT